MKIVEVTQYLISMALRYIEWYLRCIDYVVSMKSDIPNVCWLYRYRLIGIDGMQDDNEFGGLRKNAFSDINDIRDTIPNDMNVSIVLFRYSARCQTLWMYRLSCSDTVHTKLYECIDCLVQIECRYQTIRLYRLSCSDTMQDTKRY
jgi:hypothetical protein